MKRGDWLAALLAAAVGLAAGLYYTWVVSPVSYVDTSPPSLRADFKADYLTLIASAYAGTGDLARARARLALFPDPNPADTLTALAQQRLAQGWPESEARALAELAAALQPRPSQRTTPPTARATPTPSGPPTPTRTPTPVPTPRPTPTPTATPGAPFHLDSQESLCDPKLPGPLLIVEVADAAGQPVPGVEVQVIWDNGQDHFFTGLKPELGLGYGDFTMTPGITYTVQLSDSDQPVTGIASGSCTASDGTAYPGSWSLRFIQPSAQP